MAIPDTIHKESLQALAFAARQHKGSDLDPAELLIYMQDLGVAPPGVSNSFKIDYSRMQREFAIWVNGATTPKARQDLMSWVNSSVWIANRALTTSYFKGNDYIFYQSGEIDQFRGSYVKLAKKVQRDSIDPQVRRVYAIASKGTGDKWNPADVLALKSGKASNIEREMTAFGNGNSQYEKSHQSTLQEKNEELVRMFGPQNKHLKIIEDMDDIYWYNQYIDDLYKSGDCIPISLKKAESSSIRITSYDHKETKGIQDALTLNLTIDNVDWKENAQKCIVEFSLAGESGHMLDIRGSESSRKIADVQMQLQYGRAAAHGKTTLPTFSLIARMSKANSSILAQRRERSRIFGTNVKFPGSREHMFTNWRIFDDYARKTDGSTFSQSSLILDAPKWARYIEWLSNRSVNQDVIMRQFNRFLGSGSRLDYFSAAKFLKHKVQSYEVGFVMDKHQTQVREIVKENILKSIYSMASSKGFRIFGEDFITDYMTSSSYLKLGG